MCFRIWPLLNTHSENSYKCNSTRNLKLRKNIFVLCINYTHLNDSLNFSYHRILDIEDNKEIKSLCEQTKLCVEGIKWFSTADSTFQTSF